VRHQVGRHVAHIVDTSPQLATLAKVVDTDKKGLSDARTSRVLIGVGGRCAVAELLRASRREREGRAVMATGLRSRRLLLRLTSRWLLLLWWKGSR
jgi:hypothetical protein